MGVFIKEFLLYFWQHRGNYWRNIRDNGVKDFFSEEKVLALLEDFLSNAYNIAFYDADQLEADGLSPEQKMAYYEQVIWRANKFPCNGCNENGECKYCHCPLPEKFFRKGGYCDGENGSYLVWGEILSAENWKKYKKEHNINIKIETE